MKWLKTYKLYNENSDINAGVKGLLGTAVLQFMELFNLINTNLVRIVDLKSDNDNVDEYAPAVEFSNELKSEW